MPLRVADLEIWRRRRVALAPNLESGHVDRRRSWGLYLGDANGTQTSVGVRDGFGDMRTTADAIDGVDTVFIREVVAGVHRAALIP